MIFIGSFFVLTNQEDPSELERRHGEFTLLVETKTYQHAMHHFKERIASFRSSSDFFEGKCRVYLTQLLEFDRFPNNKALMLNYKSISGDPKMPYIRCSIPSEEDNACKIHQFENNVPEIEGRMEELFMEFQCQNN